MKSCKMTGNIGGQTVRCDLREGHGGNHHAVVEATREMQIETERDELHEHAEELSEALAVEREAHGATRRLLGLARAEAAEWQRKVAEAEAALNGHLVGVEDRSPEEQDASMARDRRAAVIPWRGLARVAAVTLGPPLLYVVGYVVGHAALPPIRGNGHERWVLIPFFGALGVAGAPVAVWAIAALARIVFAVSRDWIRSGFDEDAARLRLRSPDTPGVGALSEPEQTTGALSLPSGDGGAS